MPVFSARIRILVHDEAHLEPACQKLVEGIDSEQRRCHEFHSLRIMELPQHGDHRQVPKVS